VEPRRAIRYHGYQQPAVHPHDAEPVFQLAHALRRQFVVTRRARGHVELEDRKKMPLDPEHILLAEDLTGKRHITRDIAEEERFGLIIALAK
jgi:hypothetical protein